MAFAADCITRAVETFETDLDSAFLLNPDATLSVTHVGMTLEITGWSGTIYLDDFTISD